MNTILSLRLRLNSLNGNTDVQQKKLMFGLSQTQKKTKKKSEKIYLLKYCVYCVLCFSMSVNFNRIAESDLFVLPGATI